MDDLATKDPTQFEADQLLGLVDHRLRWHSDAESRLTVLTTNAPSTGLAAAWGDRLARRLTQPPAVLVRVESRKEGAFR